jgi:putative CocE/NonD family hydrolase
MAGPAPSVSERPGPFKVTREDDLAMVTRDGALLRADLYRPDTEGELPVLLRRTPYGKRKNDLAAEFSEAHFYASHGYLVVVQDTRGRFSSDGEWYPFIYEGRDGYDAIEWAAKLPGSNQKVGTIGQSYGGVVQYLAAAQRPPHLKTAVPVSAYRLSFDNYWYNSGVLELGWLLSYLVNMAMAVLEESGDRAEYERLAVLKENPDIRFASLKQDGLRHVPIADWVDRLGSDGRFLKDILGHDTDGPYWWATDIGRHLSNIDIPMLHVGSWYDIANCDTPRIYSDLREHALGESARKSQALLMGPWAHLLPYNQPTRGGSGDIDFGPEAAISLLEIQRAWFNHFLKEEVDGLPCDPVRIFVMGDNRWRAETEWPLTRARDVSLYLHGSGSANSLSGDGELSSEPPLDEPADSYTFDPDTPVDTAGGRVVGGGVADQRPNQRRSDVLVYTGPETVEDTEITGEITLHLYASSSVFDADFVAVVSDVRPDGYAQNLAEGIVRARFRESYVHPSSIVPGVVYPLRVELWHVSHVVRAGHRIRLHITSSSFPRWERNAGTGNQAGTDTALLRAEQTVFHDAEHPSRLVIPVVPQDPPPSTSDRRL